MLKTIFFVLLVWIANNLFGQCDSIRGIIIDENTQEAVQGADVFFLKNMEKGDSMGCDFFDRKITTFSGNVISNKSNSVIIQKTTSDKNGFFSLLKCKKVTAEIICSYVVKRRGYNYFVYSDMFGDTPIIRNGRITYFLKTTCPFDETKDLKICPRCHLGDMIKPIFWGMPYYDINGNTTENLDKYYLGGCSVDSWCNATKHCDRCNLML